MQRHVSVLTAENSSLLYDALTADTPDQLKILKKAVRHVTMQ